MGRPPGIALVLVTVAACPHVSAAGKPMALQPEGKRDLQAKLGASLEAAARHLGWALGLQPERPGGRKFPRLFQQHELARSEDGELEWQNACKHNVAETQDSVEFCAIRKLQALRGLCEDAGSLTEDMRRGLKAALAALEEQQEDISGLELRRDPLPKRQDGEAFVYEDERVGSGKKVLSPSVHATAIASLLRCHSAVGRQVKMSTQVQWIVAADQAVAQVAPKFTQLAHHMLGVVWEALAVVEAQLPATHPSAIAKVGKPISVVEKGMKKQFAKGAAKGVWSYSGAAAVALRAGRAELGTAERERLRALAVEHVERFRGSLLPGMNTTQLCTCGPVSGLAPLATLLQDARLAMLVLELVTKDIDLFQVPPGADSAPGAEAGLLAGVGEPERFAGAFLRGPEQLQLEGRPRTLRLDDTATCLAAVSAALRMVDAMPAVEADLGQAAEGPAVASEAPGGHSEL